MSTSEFFVKKQRFPDEFELQSRKSSTSETQSYEGNNTAGKELKQRLARFKTSGKFHVLGRFMNDCDVDAKKDTEGGTLNTAYEMDIEEIEESHDGEGAESFIMDSSFSENEEQRPKLYEEEPDELVLYND